MAHNASRGLFIHSLLSVIHAGREWGNCQLVSRNIGTFSTSVDVHSYSSNISNIPHTNIYYGPLSLGTPLQQFPHGNTSRPLRTLKYPYAEQPQTLYPVPATNASLHDCQPSTSQPQSSLGPPQERAESGLLGVSFCANTSTGPPPAAATANLRRDESEPQATTLPSR